MNERAAVQAVYTVLDSARASLVTGITHNGVARTIKHLSTTNLAAPVEYYAVSVECTSCKEFSMQGANSVAGVPWAVYEMVIQLGDVANIQPSSDTNPYETAHADFRKLRDRVVKLIRETVKWMPASSANPRFRLAVGNGEYDRPVSVENQNFTFSDIEDVEYAMLFSRISFSLQDHCSDSSLLY